MRFDHELTRRELVEFAKPHWIGALINMATTAVSTERNAATAAKNRSAQLSAANMGRKGPEDYHPTAGLAQKAKGDDTDINSLGLRDLPQGRSISDLNAPPATTEADFHVSDSTQPNAESTGGIVQSNYQPDTAQNVGVGGQQPNSNNNYAQYANALSGIVGSLMQRQQKPPSQMPQAGQSNFSPTALAILARRKQDPYGQF